MFRHSSLGLAGLLLAAGFVAGCKPKPSTGPGSADAFFATPFQNESQYIVEAIASDLAEQVYYATTRRLPNQKHFLVAATEKPGSTVDTPVYDLHIRLDPKQKDLSLELPINSPIWSASVYQPLVVELARAAGLSARSASKTQDTALIVKLNDCAPETIEEQNQQLSAALEADFTNPQLHEDAALLLGAFLLRESSGHFFEIRSPLSRMTAHLAMARFLRGADPYGINGRMAEAILLTLIGNEAPALEHLNSMGTNDAAVVAMLRALRACNTGDYRSLDQAQDRTPIENIAWFTSLASYAGTPSAWMKLSDDQKQTIGFVRAANAFKYSVEIGHELLQTALPLELKEIASIYELSHHEKLERNALAKVLNDLPERCFSSSGGSVHVRIIGWGQWAMFFQRHLCHAVQQNYNFMNVKWGVPDEASQFAAQCERQFGGLRLYPFVRRFNCSDVRSYHKAVDDSFKVIVATPQLVPSRCWNQALTKVRFAPFYCPHPNPHINEWHNHNPPPGTLYDLDPRLIHPSLIGRPDAVARFEQLHELAPYDCRVANYILVNKYHHHPTYDQAMGLFRPLLPYSVTALETVAGTVTNKPEQYEQLMVQAAELNPACYYTLGDFVLNRQQDDKAAQYIDKACAADPDAVRVSNHAVWRVRYYLKKGNTDKAREIADQGGEVYSFVGLEAKALFLEATTNYDEAFEWFAKLEERYNDSWPALEFCIRYKGQTGDQHFDPEVQRRIRKLFPKGIEKVALRDFNGPPADGVLIRQENALLKAAGLNKGDVIVAVYGVRVHNLLQYAYGRELKQTPEMDLVVWQGDAYRAFKPSPPRHRFGLDFGDYTATPAGTR
jgi:tetratricopeptide (TPR) repeat protein